MRRNLVATGSALLLALVVTVPTATPALASPEDRDDVEQRQDEVQQGLQDSQEDLDHVNAQLVAAADRLQALESRLPAARDRVSTAQAAAQTARDRDAALAEELDLAEGAVTAAGLELGQRTAEADETEKVVGSVAREVYQGSGFNPLEILVQADSARDYADMVAFAAVARRSENQALSRLRVQQADIRNAEAKLEAERVRVDNLKQLAAEQVLATQAAEGEARQAEADLEGLVDQQDQAVAAFATAKAEEERQIAQLAAEDDALTAQLARIAEAERKAEEERIRKAEAERQAAIAAAAERAAAQAAQAAQVAAEAEARRQAEIARQRAEAERKKVPPPPPPPPPPPAAPPAAVAAPPAVAPAPSGSGYLSRPVNARTTSSFGYRIHPILGYRKLHTGQDFGAACGTPIKAAADGTVVQAGPGGGYGNFVVITHGIVGGDGLATAYAHLSRIATSGGARVSRGDVIGYVGNTGSSTGCHLHFETRVNGVAVDPLGFL